jgi:uncharacterized membrane protein
VSWSGSSERRRVLMCVAVGGAAGAVSATVTVWQLAVLSGWIVAATALLVWVWLEIGRLDADTTARVATREDDSRAAARGVLVASSVLSLVAIIAALHRASTGTVELQVALTAASLVAVVVSWLVVNTVFVLRYAHLFYGGGSTGGVEFPGGEAPSYREFAYLAFTVGMTFQVSDTAVTEGPFRAAVLRNALLSFVFSIAIIALTINVVAGLVA